MLRKVLVVLLLVLSLFLFACGSDDEEKGTENQVTSAVDSDKETSEGTATTDKLDSSKTDVSDKNSVGGDKNVTDGTTTKNAENTVNIGGIEFEMPEGSKLQPVFVGAGVTYEVKPLQGMLRSFYFDSPEDVDLVENVADFVRGVTDKSFENNFVMNYLDKFECVEDTVIDVAGLAARKLTYKGVSNGDCYRDGPVKNLVDATLETVCIYNDVEEKMVMLMGLCKSGKAADLDKAILNMLANAENKQTDSTLGLYGDSKVKNGGFSFEIPSVFGKLAECAYDSFGESYVYHYGPKSQLSENLAMGINFIMNFDIKDMFGGFMGGMPPVDLGGLGAGGFDLGGLGADGFDVGGFLGGNGAGIFGADDSENDGAGEGGMPGFGMPGLGGFDGFGGMGGNFLSDNTVNWLNVLSIRQVFTKEEFAKALELASENVPTVFGMLLSDCECTLKEKIAVDGMDGIRFTFTGLMGDTPAECKLLVINNIKDRFLTVLTSVYDAEGNELSDAFEELVGSMKLVD